MKPRIRFLINTLDGGGAEKVLLNLLHQMDPEAYDLSLVSIKGGAHEHTVPKFVKYRKIVTCKKASLRNLLAKVIQKLPPKLFAGLFLRGQYDIEIAYLEGTATRFMAAKSTKGAKVAFVHCDVSVSNMIKPFYPSAAACLQEYQTFSKVCFVSKQGLAGFEGTYGVLKNGCVVHNVIDTAAILEKASQSADRTYPERGLKLVTVGRLSAPKGYLRLMQIVAELEKQHDFELWIVGEGEDRSALEQIIDEKKLRSVKLLGFHQNPYPYVKQADLFVCSSYSEGYSTAVTEAILLDVPVLTTDCAGMDEILDGGKYGMIVENSDEGLRQGLTELLENPEALSRLKMAAEKRSQELSGRSAMGEYEALFHEICTREVRA